jgi:hypothetical protein
MAGPVSIQYDLAARLYHMRRDSLPTLLHALGKYITRRERQGEMGEGVLVWYSGEDWAAILVMTGGDQ